MPTPTVPPASPPDKPTPAARSKAAPKPTAATPAPAATAAPARPRRRVPYTLFAWILIALYVAAVITVAVVVNRQGISDQLAVWGYEDSSAIDEYLDDSTMTEHALYLFKASKPRIAADSEFNDVCGSNEGGDGLLGCYTRDSKRITLFEIEDNRLAGFQEAVASHEMLHAAWDRLDVRFRNHLIPLLDAEVERLADDEVFQDQLDAYDFENDGVRYDELHALIGTEVVGISDYLEDYYAQYFTDRPALVDRYITANQVLVEIAEQVAALNEDLEELDTKITEAKKSYEDGYDKLNADVDAFNARNNAYYYKTQRAFDIDRNKLIAREKVLDQLFDEINTMIDEYNDKLDELTELDEEAAELYGSINLDRESIGL